MKTNHELPQAMETFITSSKATVECLRDAIKKVIDETENKSDAMLDLEHTYHFTCGFAKGHEVKPKENTNEKKNKEQD